MYIRYRNGWFYQPYLVAVFVILLSFHKKIVYLTPYYGFLSFISYEKVILFYA